ncbi:AAA family ATPase [Methylobacterium sp. E-016]|uniref:AAA family ATPase n=1 Tax=Methylobacterium sp. E-016 TaxID=2836556 RepID=UPI001FBBE8A0|nr:AAA family ATPase [Methylobacterium sp. E-016]MCJ2075403.1 AAA family ATPase [Methylobacterium sp. E-016]
MAVGVLEIRPMPRTPLRGAVAPSTRALYANAPLLNDLVADDCLVWTRSLIPGTPCLEAMRDFFQDDPCVFWTRGLHLTAYWAHIGKIPGSAGEKAFVEALEAAYDVAARNAGTPADAMDNWWWEASHRVLVYLIEMGGAEFLEPAREVVQTYARDASAGAPEHQLAYGLTLLDPAYLRVRRRGEPAYARQRAVDQARIALGMRETHAAAMHDDRPTGGLAGLPVAAPSAAERIEAARADEAPPGHVYVLRSLGGNTSAAHVREMKTAVKDILGVALPLVPVPADWDVWERTLLAEFPTEGGATRAIREKQSGNKFWRGGVHMLHGPAGVGKTRFCRTVAEVSGLPFERVNLDNSADSSALGGTPSRWTSAGMTAPFALLNRFRKGNGVLALDEYDKASGSIDSNGGRAWDVCHGLWGVETNSAWHEVFVNAPVDVSNVLYLVTANELSRIPAPLMDRMDSVTLFSAPGPEHLAILAPQIAREICRRQGLDERWGVLDAEEMSALSAWRGGSIRQLTKLVELVLRSRESGPAALARH